MQVRSLLTVLICIICSAPLSAEYDVSDLKSLFTDENQRAQIDAARFGNYKESGLHKTSRVRVLGYVTRSDGKSVAWVNNNNTLESSKVNNLKVHQSSIGKNKKVGVSFDGKHIRLKPGETWSEDTGVTDTIK